MKGAIAAGHRLTAEAGARALAQGGNAVDACVAAAFASWVAESPLTGPGGGGFMLVHTARDRRSRVLDFFAAVPGIGGFDDTAQGPMDEVLIDFADASTQVFLIGAASCAVPGMAAGLEAAHRAFGRLPWRELVEPAVELARGGIELTPAQANLHAILHGILAHTPEARLVYGDDPLGVGEQLVLDDLAETLQQLAEEGAAAIYQGELGRAICAHVQSGGGVVTTDDLAAYRVVWRRPVRGSFARAALVSNPPPSSGGVLIAYGLRLLEALGQARQGSAEAMAAMIEVMREQARARDGRFAIELHRGGLARRLEAEVEAAVARIRARLPGVPELAPAGTTHISVVDAAGNAASLSGSTGAGSGVVVPGTGIYLNNMLGEPDLTGGRALRPGRRLTSMMAPTIALADGSPRLVVGSAGSARLRGAIMQIVVNVLAHGISVDEAIRAARVHVEGDEVHCEGGADGAELDRLEALGYELVRWSGRNLFFGGAAAVEVRPGGELAAAGDPRRGGHGVVIG